VRVTRLLLALALFVAGTIPARATGIELAIAGVATWYASIGVVGQLLVQVGIGLALTAASYGLSYLLGQGGQQQAQVEAEQARGIELPEFAGLLRVRRLYGETTVTGGVFFHQTVAVGGSAPNHWIFGLAVSEGICESLESVVINGVECPLDIDGNPQVAPWYNASGNFLKASFRSGTDDQAMDSIISDRFPSPPDDFYPDAVDRATRWTQFRQRGVCTVVLDMTVGADRDEHTELWGAGGIPEIKLKVKGLWLYDRRNGSHDPDDKTTWDWSANATLVIEDYLCAEIGGQTTRAEIDDTSARASIVIDDEWVGTLGDNERRGRINGLVTSEESPIDVLGSLLQTNRGTLRKAEGAYHIRADRPAASVATIYKGLWLRSGAISTQNEPDTRSAIDGIVAQFYPSSRFGEAAETAYPSTALDSPTATRVTYRFGDSAAQVQRLGYAMLTDNAYGATVSGQFDIAALVATGKANRQLEVGDVIYWDAPSPYDDMNGLYRVDGLSLNSDFTLSLSLAGTDPSIINGWNTSLETALEEAA